MMGNTMAGALAGAITLFAFYPLDFVRTRLSMDVGKESAREFKGF